MTLEENKAALVEAHRNQDWELAKLLSFQRQRLKNRAKRRCSFPGCDAALRRTNTDGRCRMHSSRLISMRIKNGIEQVELTDRQKQISKMYVELEDMDLVAARLSISRKTIEWSLATVRRKLGVGSLIGLVKYVLRSGWAANLVVAMVAFLSLGAGNPHYATITLYQSPSGMGYLSGAGNYYVGSKVTIATQPSNTLFTFHSWQDGNTNYTRTITIPKYGQAFTAYYVPIPQPPVALTNAFVYWKPGGPSDYDYDIFLTPGQGVSTFQTNFMLTGLTNGLRYSLYVRAKDSNGIPSSPTCTLTFVAGVKGTNACP